MYNLFNYNLPNVKTQIINKENSKIDKSKNEKLVRVVKRRKEIEKIKKKRVEICPMCGKIADQCDCGYMR